jgi:hypothetical protein
VEGGGSLHAAVESKLFQVKVPPVLEDVDPVGNGCVVQREGSIDVVGVDANSTLPS